MSDEALIQAAIAAVPTGGLVTLDAGRTYAIAQTIHVPANVTLDLNGGTLTTDRDINLVWLHEDGAIRGGTIKVTTPGYTKAALYLDARDTFASRNRTTAHDLTITGPSTPGGVGVHLYAGIEARDSYIQSVRIHDVSIENFDKAILLQNAKSMANGLGQFANANSFARIWMENCRYFIYLDGEPYGAGRHWETTGNVFTDLWIEPTPIMVEAFHITCDCNIISAMIWDPGRATLPDARFVKFHPGSRHNRVDLYTPFISAKWIEDAGTGNLVITNGLLSPAPRTSDQAILPGTHGQAAIMAGEQDDYLAWMDRRTPGAITQTSGSAPTAGTLANLLAPGASEARWTSPDPVTIEIKAQMYWPGWIGVLFGSEARRVRIEVYNNLTATWVTVQDTTSNYARAVVARCPAEVTSITKVRVTLAHATTFRVSRIFAQSTYAPGQVWLPRVGGDIYGDITSAPGAGPVVRTPDGTKKYRLGVDAAGVVTATPVP